MKRILSLMLVFAMMLTLVPTAFAQTADGTIKTGQAEYTAKVGDTVSVPVYVVGPENADIEIDADSQVYVNLDSYDGVTVVAEPGLVPAKDYNIASGQFRTLWESNFTATNTAPLFTIKYTFTKAGTYNLTFSGMEIYSPATGDVYNLEAKGAKIVVKAGAPVVGPDADFDKFKAKGVYYEATLDFENTGLGSGMHMNVTDNPYIYNVGTAEGLAAFKADPLYATLGPIIEGVIKSTSAKYASYTDKDQAYNFVDYQGKHAMYGINNVATKFEDSTWKKCLGAPNMYWMIDDDYFKNTDTNATFVIQYYDNTGSFNVRYSKQGGGATPFTVEKGGTNTWVTKAFHVTDAMLNTGLTATGLIDNHTGRFESASETYISKFAVLKTADYNDIMGKALPSLEETLPENASAFLKNSTLVAKLDFDSGNFTKDAKLTDTIDGFKGYAIDNNFYLDAAEVATGNLAAHLYRDAKVVTSDTGTQFSTWTPENALVDAPYAIVTYKTNSNNSYDRVNLGFNYKKTTLTGVDYEGSVVSSDDNGLPMIIKNDQIQREGKRQKPWDDPADTGCDNKKTIENGKYLGDWHTYTYLIDTLAKKAYLYIDGKYVMSLVIYRNRDHGAYDNELGKTYVSGIKSIQFAQDRDGSAIDGKKVMQTYYDDIMVRRMSAEQYAATFGADKVEVAGNSITTAEALPTKTKVYGIPVVWTTDNANVTVNAEGKIALAGATKYDKVKLTATFNGVTKEFVVTVMAEPKYAEYIFGAKEDKAFGMTSYNVIDNFYTQTKDGLTIRNSIVKFDEQRTMYFIVDDLANPGAKAASHEVSKEEYDACELEEGIGKKSYKVQYANTSSKGGDSGCNRYDAVGPDVDKRAAIFGTAHLRNDSRLTKRATNSMIHFDTGSTFSSSDNALVIEVDVLDVGTHTVDLQYCNKSGALGGASSDKLTDSGEWITLTYNLTDADFAWTKGTGLGNEKQDFRFQLSQPTYISAVRVYNVEEVDVAEDDYIKYELEDYDVMINEDNTITAKTAITAEEAKDAKLYVAFYDAKGDLVGVATSAQVKDGDAQTVVTGKSVGATYNTVDYTLKTFVWDADLKPLR